jgi:hypothetical protein
MRKLRIFIVSRWPESGEREDFVTLDETEAIERLNSTDRSEHVSMWKRDLCLEDFEEKDPCAPTACAVAFLNQAFEKDPDAITSVMLNPVPCDASLEDDEHVLVNPSMSRTGFVLSALGLLNGYLSSVGGKDVALSSSGEGASYKIIGFEESS